MLHAVRTAAYEMGLFSWTDIQADQADARNHHALVLSENGQPLGCARITRDGLTERMAILPIDNRAEIESALRLVAQLNDPATLSHK